MSKPKPFYRRSFLNKKNFHGLAALMAKVTSGGSSGHAWISAEVTLSDCNRQVSLDFDVYRNAGDTRASIENALYKLDMLIETLVSFRAAFLEHIEHTDSVVE